MELTIGQVLPHLLTFAALGPPSATSTTSIDNISTVMLKALQQGCLLCCCLQCPACCSDQAFSGDEGSLRPSLD